MGKTTGHEESFIFTAVRAKVPSITVSDRHPRSFSSDVVTKASWYQFYRVASSLEENQLLHSALHSDMETEKLQRLYDTLEKLRPKGKHGGLGQGLYAAGRRAKDPTLPDTPLYSHFVRPGAFHKRTFDNESKEAEAEAEATGADAPGDEQEQDQELEALDAALRKAILRALKAGRVDRKQAAKDLQQQLSLPKKDYKRAFKRVLNALIDDDRVVLHEDGAMERVERDKSKKRRKS